MRIFIICVCMIFLISCYTTGPIKLPEKYVLDNQLESVTYISKYQGYSSWDKLDNQSFILQASPNKYYLIVLQTPAPDLPFSESIIISRTGSGVRAGMDTVTLLGQSIKGPPYIIEKIYSLEGRKQVQIIKEQIRDVK